jgi:hypothetical protein
MSSPSCSLTHNLFREATMREPRVCSRGDAP